MNEFIVLSVCVSAVLITFLIYLMSKQRPIDFSWDNKNQKLSVKAHHITPNKDDEYVLPKSIKDVIPTTNVYNHYDNFNPSKEVASLEIYQEFTRVISHCELQVNKDITHFIGKNHINEKTSLEYNKYIKEKINLFYKVYNDAFSSSYNGFIKNLTLESMLGAYDEIFRLAIKQFYEDVLLVHKDGFENFNKELVSVHNRIKNDRDDIIAHTNSLYSIFSNVTFNDIELMVNLLKRLSNMLLGIFHDKLKESIKRKFIDETK